MHSQVEDDNTQTHHAFFINHANTNMMPVLPLVRLSLSKGFLKEKITGLNLSILAP
jgi:hypothetical protein